MQKTINKGGDEMSNGATHSKESVRVKISEEILKKIIYADTHQEHDGESNSRLERLYEHTCNLRETQIYKLLQDFVAQMNDRLKMRRERMRVVDEGQGIYIELE